MPTVVVPIQSKHQCECFDPMCPHPGMPHQCQRTSSIIVYRIDMDDSTGTSMCTVCADDAMESGVFTYSRPRAFHGRLIID